MINRLQLTSWIVVRFIRVRFFRGVLFGGFLTRLLKARPMIFFFLMMLLGRNADYQDRIGEVRPFDVRVGSADDVVVLPVRAH